MKLWIKKYLYESVCVADESVDDESEAGRQAGATEIVLTCPQNTDDPTLKLTEQVRECRSRV